MRMKMLPWIAALVLPGLAAAGVTANGPPGFVVRQERVVAADPARVWSSFEQIGQWWDDAHTYSGKAANLTLDLRAGGCFCERWPGGEIEHLRVAYVSAASHQLVMTGGLGPLLWLGASGSLIVKLAPAEGGTKISWEYRVSGYQPDGWEKTAASVDAVLGQQVDRLVRHATTGP